MSSQRRVSDTSLGAPVPQGVIRVLVVDDSSLQRGVLVALLDSDPDIEVVGWAANGEDAIRAAARLRPDAITMDLQMPVMDGLEATRRIMQETPTPIVLVTASVSPEDRRRVQEALDAGVLAVVSKPMIGATGKAAVDAFLRTIKNMSQVKVLRRWTPERLSSLPAAPAALVHAPPHSSVEVVAIGASTGGPQALHDILTRIPSTFVPPILIVQHIAPGFAASVVDWLKPNCAVPIQLATAGQRLDRPGIYLAPADCHMIVRGRMIVLTNDPLSSGHRPSATVLFRAVAADYGAAAIGVLLTGMGDDGAAGLRDMKRSGAVTIAQDEASSVVFGMPAAAIALGVVDHVSSPSAIASLLAALTGARGHPQGNT